MGVGAGVGGKVGAGRAVGVGAGVTVGVAVTTTGVGATGRGVAVGGGRSAWYGMLGRPGKFKSQTARNNAINRMAAVTATICCRNV